MRPTAQEDAATSGGTTVSKTSKVDPFGISSGGEFDTSDDDASDDGTSDGDNSDGGTSDDDDAGYEDGGDGSYDNTFDGGTSNDDADQLEDLITTGSINDDDGGTTNASDVKPYGFVRKSNTTNQQLETPATTKRDSLLNKVRSEAYTLTPFGALKNVITNIKEGFGTDNSAEDEGNVIKLLSEVNNNPENVTAIIENISAQDSTALASNLMSPRFGYESGRDDLQQRMVTGPGGVERLPLTDSQTLANKLVSADIAANNRRLAEIEARQAQIELDRETRRKEQQEQNDRDGDRDSSNAGDFTGGQTDRGSGATAGGYGGTGRGRSGYNKGGLASRKTKKKREK